MIDPVQRAYATLELPFGAPLAQVKRRYRLLVKRWHPDRFASDPRSQAEASERLARINSAYELLAHAPAATPPVASARLSREQIDRMVDSIGREGPIDWLLGGFERIRYPSRDLPLDDASPLAIAAGLFLVGVIVALHVRYGHAVADTVMLALVAIAAVVARLARGRL